MSKSHSAAFLDGVKKEFRVGPLETRQPAAGEVLIRTKAIAINPVDWKVQDEGSFLDKYPAVLGEDLAGVVEAVGDDVSRFKPGQRVIAHSQFLMLKKNEMGSFQELVIVPAVSVAAIPDSMKFEDAAVLPLAISTAAAGLYMSKKELALELDPPTTNPKRSGKTLLVWGGSSSVGITVIQLARASGVDVVATCSPRNFDLVKKFGATAFDYNSPSIVGDLVAALQKGEFVGAYDAIGARESSMQTAQVVAQFGGGIMASVLPPAEDIPATVQSKFLFALNIFFGSNASVGKAVWENYLADGLAAGELVPAPPAEVVGHGLEAVQDACAKQKAGVSAKKIVVALQ